MQDGLIFLLCVCMCADISSVPLAGGSTAVSAPRLLSKTKDITVLTNPARSEGTHTSHTSHGDGVCEEDEAARKVRENLRRSIRVMKDGIQTLEEKLSGKPSLVISNPQPVTNPRIEEQVHSRPLPPSLSLSLSLCTSFGFGFDEPNPLVFPSFVLFIFFSVLL